MTDVERIEVPSSLAADRRRAAWLHSLALWQPDVRFATPLTPHGTLVRLSLGDVRLWHVATSGQTFAREPQALRNRTWATVLVQLSGRTLLHQLGRQVELVAGTFTLMSDASPSVLESDGPSEQLLAELPRQGGDATAISPAAFALRMDGRGAADRPLLDCLTHLRGAVPALDPVQRIAAGDAIRSLARMVSAVQVGRERARRHVRVERAMAYVAEHLADPELTPAAVAAAQRVSRRHLDELFGRYGTSVERWIRGRRLAAAADALVVARSSGATVLAIALEHGFTSASHFTRAFGRHYGMTPTQWRAAHGAGSRWS